MEDNYLELLNGFGFTDEQVKELLTTLTQKTVSDPSQCKHLTVNGDLFGASCTQCGQIMQGRGYGGDAKKQHHFVLLPTGKYGCLYCKVEMVVG